MDITEFSFYSIKGVFFFCFIITYPCVFTDFIAKFAPILIIH